MDITGLLDQTQKSMQDQMKEMLKKQQESLLKEQQGSITKASLSATSASERLAEMKKEDATAVSNLFSKDAVTMSDGVAAMMKRHQSQQELQLSKLDGLASVLAVDAARSDMEAQIQERRSLIGQVSADAGVKSVEEIKQEADNQMVEQQHNMSQKERAQAAANGETISTEVSVKTGAAVPHVSTPKVSAPDIKIKAVKAPHVNIKI
ncbi:hypothetical protein [Halodesulfovibrio aestuarii]|uniref:Uncharacterized protein n=1 Tax=Halodesulfovibrio aestuarii TaxID=126333 RepID=A0ABV4JS83_9BACT